LKIEFVKNRTFGFKFISMFASPISLFVKWSYVRIQNVKRIASFVNMSIQ
jgi:hypothetical protein